jgi:Fungal Zn(2)-Cys(6) binuclear cluster domain
MDVDQDGSPQAGEKHACVPCYTRKVKCDRQHPCNTCTRTKADCVYRDPAPPRRKKRMTEKDLLERIEKYEDHLKRAGIPLGDLYGKVGQEAESADDAAESRAELPIDEFYVKTAPQEAESAGGSKATAKRASSPRYTTPFGKTPGEDLLRKEGGGALVTDSKGRSRYLENNLWVALHNELKNPGQIVGENEPASSSDDDSANAGDMDPAYLLFSAGSTVKNDLAAFFPAAKEANLLWQTYVKNVSPISKFIHIPTTSKLVEKAQENPRNLSTNEIALLLSIFYLATISSLRPSECEKAIVESKDTIQRRYRFLTQQALIKAQFLRSSDLMVLQAFVHYLVSCTCIGM